MARKKKTSNKWLVLILFFICLFTGYQYDGTLSWKNVLNVDRLGSVLSGTVSTNTSSGGTKDAVFMVHFIDVGQGDSILLQSLQPGQPAENILIDAGEYTEGEKVVQYLEEQNVETLNAIVATHPHSDHIGGLPEVFQQFEVENVYMPKKVHTTKTFEKLVNAIQEEGLKAHVACSGMSIPMNGASIQILAPVSGEEYDSLNNYSIVLAVSVQGKQFLLTGDAEKLSEKEQLTQDFQLKSEILKVGHHGSKTSSSQEYIEAVSPEYAVISCGKDNDYGLPAQDTLDTLENAGCTILRTDESGTIVMKVKNGELTVLEEK